MVLVGCDYLQVARWHGLRANLDFILALECRQMNLLFTAPFSSHLCQLFAQMTNQPLGRGGLVVEVGLLLFSVLIPQNLLSLDSIAALNDVLSVVPVHTAGGAFLESVQICTLLLERVQLFALHTELHDFLLIKYDL